MIGYVKKAGIAVLLGLPAVLAFLLIVRYGVNVIWWDQWGFVSLIDSFHTGTLTFADLIAQHNEHRYLVYRVIVLALGGITHWNTVAEMYFSWALLCLICFVLYRIFTIPSGSSWRAAAWFIPVPWLMFSLRQFENLLWGFQIVFYTLILCVLLAIYLLQQSRGLDWRFVIAVLCGIIGTFSITNGLLIWIIGGLQLAAIGLTRPAGEKSRLLWSWMLWLVISAGIYILYFWGYQKPPNHPSLIFFFQHPAVAIEYAFAALGCLFSFNTPTAIVSGLVLAVLYTLITVLVLKDLKNRLPYLPWLFAIMFTCGSVVLLVLGRSGFGVEQALSSRYISITVIGIIGLYCIAVNLKPAFIRLKPAVAYAAVALLVLFMFILDLYVPVMIKGRYDSLKLVQTYLITYQLQPDNNLTLLCPDARDVKNYSPILQKYRLNVFYEAK